MKNRYRIVSDTYAGYETQVKFWFFPVFWFQMHKRGLTNSFSSLKSAEDFINREKVCREVFKDEV